MERSRMDGPTLEQLQHLSGFRLRDHVHARGSPALFLSLSLPFSISLLLPNQSSPLFFSSLPPIDVTFWFVFMLQIFFAFPSIFPTRIVPTVLFYSRLSVDSLISCSFPIIFCWFLSVYLFWFS